MGVIANTHESLKTFMTQETNSDMKMLTGGKFFLNSWSEELMKKLSPGEFAEYVNFDIFSEGYSNPSIDTPKAPIETTSQETGYKLGTLITGIEKYCRREAKSDDGQQEIWEANAEYAKSVVKFYHQVRFNRGLMKPQHKADGRERMTRFVTGFLSHITKGSKNPLSENRLAQLGEVIKFHTHGYDFNAEFLAKSGPFSEGNSLHYVNSSPNVRSEKLPEIPEIEG